MQYFFTSQLGPTRFELADGALLCKDVPIARTGLQVYDESQLEGVEGDDDGEIVVTRTPDEVFRPETLASFEGMTFTVLHPKEFVNPGNWKEYSHGHIQNVRRGTGEQSDLMLADIHVKSADAIKAIYAGQDQISLGYDANYEQTAKGKANQHTIIGNHCALVPDGRAGIRCSIGDSISMALTKKSWFASLKQAIKTKDAKAIDEAIALMPDEMDQADVTMPSTLNINIAPAQPLPPEKPLGGLTVDEGEGEEEAETLTLAALKAQMDTLTAMVEKMCGTGTATVDSGDDDEDEKDEKKKATTDSGYHQSVIARAELIMPGMKLEDGGKLASFKRSVMDAAFKTVEGKTILVPIVGADPDFAKMPKTTLDSVFVAASEIAKAKNSTVNTPVNFYDEKSNLSPANLNKAYQAFWNKGK